MADLPRTVRSGAIEQQLLTRYQTAVDDDLHKAIRALREAQEWRLSTSESAAKSAAECTQMVA